MKWPAFVSPTGALMPGAITMPLGTVLILAGTAAISQLLANHGALYHRRYDLMMPKGARTR